jgi:hypothetical protein
MSKSTKGHQNLIPTNKRTKEEQRRITTMGGIASGKSRRANKTLSDRIKLALTISTNENIKALKRQIKELWPNRESAKNRVMGDKREIIKTLLAQTKTIRECGIDVYNILKIAERPESQDVAMRATNALWDREEGKAKQSSTVESTNNTSTTIKYIELEEKKGYLDHIGDVIGKKD